MLCVSAMNVSQVASSWVSVRLHWEGAWADMKKAGVEKCK